MGGNLNRAKKEWRRRERRRNYEFLRKQNEHQGWLDKLLRITKGNRRK